MENFKPKPDADIKIRLVATFTESPSFNVRILHNGSTIFYNSDRLQGNKRLWKVGKLLDIHSIMVGEYDLVINQDQFNQISEMGMYN